MTDQPQRPRTPLVRDPQPLRDRLLLGYVEDPPATTRTTFVAALRAVLSMAAEELDVALIDDERMGSATDQLPTALRVEWYRRGQNAGTITMINRIVSRIEQAFDSELTGLAAMEAKEAASGFHLGADRTRELDALMRACRAIPVSDETEEALDGAAARVVEWLECHTSLGEDRDERG